MIRYFVLKISPKNLLSYLIGKLANIKAPRPFSTWSIRIFAYCFKIDLLSISKPVEDFNSIGEFFIRDLRAGLRKIDEGLVSPVDGTLRSIHNGEKTEVKGKDYTIIDLLQDKDQAAQFANGRIISLYLAPKDYHHVHYPVSGVIIGSSYIPGYLWPVNDWSLANIPKLFAVNERLVTYIKSEFGLIAVVMVGATNVGKITVTYDSWVTNTKPLPLFRNLIPIHRTYDESINIKAGDRLGTFHLGSTVLLLLEAESPVNLEKASMNIGKQIQYGQQLGR